MSKATSNELAAVHSSLADLILEELTFIRDHNQMVASYEGDPDMAPVRIRLESALVNSIARFLNDNEITADPADNDDLKDLQQQLIAKSAAARSSILSKARSLEDEVH